MENKIKHYLENGKHLPEFLKDFHDQKDVFKTMYNHLNDNDSNMKEKLSWSDAQIFTIDYFLWYMAMHGYKLQQIKSKNIDFMDIKESLKKYKP